MAPPRSDSNLVLLVLCETRVCGTLLHRVLCVLLGVGVVFASHGIVLDGGQGETRRLDDLHAPVRATPLDAFASAVALHGTHLLAVERLLVRLLVLVAHREDAVLQLHVAC